MKEIPILFSTQMVDSILQGIKIQTRRIVKTSQKGWDPQKMEFVKTEDINSSFFENKNVSNSLIKDLTGFHAFFKDRDNDMKLSTKCPYGQPGDILWVKETWQKIEGNRIIFKAAPIFWGGKWRRSIFMKKQYARIWLKISEVKVERLQDISEEDAKAEGILPLLASSTQLVTQARLYFDYSKPRQFFNDGLPAFWSFNSLWCSINGGESWEANPWVWVITFKVLSTTGKPDVL
jgi:hypothetical protein